LKKLNSFWRDIKGNTAQYVSADFQNSSSKCILWLCVVLPKEGQKNDLSLQSYNWRGVLIKK